MSKVTSKLQVSIPKAVAEQFGIVPGGEIEWVAAGETIRVVPVGRAGRKPDTAFRLRLFEDATRRQRARQKRRRSRSGQPDRGWKREDLYVRGGAD